MPFDLSMWKLLVLGLIATVVFGPDKLPGMARDAARMLRQLRTLAQTARTELQSELGDTVGEFDLSELNPRTFVRKHLFEDDTILGQDAAGAKPAPLISDTARANGSWIPPTASQAATAALVPGEPAPYDADAT